MSDEWKTATDFHSWSWVIARRNINEKLRTHKRTDIQEAVDSHAEIPINKLFYFKIDAEIIAEKENKNQTKTNKQKDPKTFWWYQRTIPSKSWVFEYLVPNRMLLGENWEEWPCCSMGVCHWEKEGFEVLKDLLHIELLSATRFWRMKRVFSCWGHQHSHLCPDIMVSHLL